MEFNLIGSDSDDSKMPEPVVEIEEETEVVVAPGSSAKRLLHIGCNRSCDCRAAKQQRSPARRIDDDSKLMAENELEKISFDFLDAGNCGTLGVDLVDSQPINNVRYD